MIALTLCLIAIGLTLLVILLDVKSWIAGSWVLPLLLVAFLLLVASLGGCKTAPEPSHPPAKTSQDLAEEAACQPLPLCDVPPEANAKQLSSALWGCVLEYRALYSACFHLVQPPPPVVK